MSKFYPKMYVDTVIDINIEELKKNNIKGLILDVDNTLIDLEKVMPEGVKEWVLSLKKEKFKLYILSNSNKKKKVKEVSRILNIPYAFFGLKPLKYSFKKLARHMKLETTEIAMVGDQIFTDIWGANRVNMYPILVKPISKKDILITIIKRPIEERIIKNYLNKQKKNEE